jgi:hypothetical protein
VVHTDTAETVDTDSRQRGLDSDGHWVVSLVLGPRPGAGLTGPRGCGFDWAGRNERWSDVRDGQCERRASCVLRLYSPQQLSTRMPSDCQSSRPQTKRGTRQHLSAYRAHSPRRTINPANPVTRRQRGEVWGVEGAGAGLDTAVLRRPRRRPYPRWTGGCRGWIRPTWCIGFNRSHWSSALVLRRPRRQPNLRYMPAQLKQ